MKVFRLLLNGTNFVLRFDGTPSRMGFYTTRFVEAPDAEAARTLAIQRLWEDRKLAVVLNEESDPPKIVVDKVEAVLEAGRDTGFAFYEESLDDG